MADTTTTFNNKGVSYRGKAGREPAGVDNAAPMAPSASEKKLSPRGRKKAKSAIKRGMISEKAAKKHFGADS